MAEYTWNQPMCDACWRRERGERTPVRVRESELEQCAFCGFGTSSGIYVRQDPLTVKYPRIKED
jgi:ribosome-binding protein aMBF1 (putative translation factor)